VYKAYLAKLELAHKQYGFTILDKRHSDFLTPEYFTDGIHLTPAGAARFSSSMTGDFQSAFAFASR
jgi:lysophospholipase L1-like esterase